MESRVRKTKPDIENEERLIWIKMVRCLYLTNQIKMMRYLGFKKKKTVEIRILRIPMNSSINSGEFVQSKKKT